MTSSATPVVRTLCTPDELGQATTLYRDVFGYTDLRQGASPRLLTSLRDNGGSVVGARDGSRVIAFAYGFHGTDGISTYHYSQAAVVHPEHQGRGLGRALKSAQRQVALGWGTTRMRWTYDPVIARNAHFNLDVLGAVARWFHGDLYGIGADRLVVDWDLTRPPGPAAPPHDLPSGTAGWAHLIADGDLRWLPIPTDFAALAEREPKRAAEVRTDLAAELDTLMGDGWAAVSCAPYSPDTAIYRFERVG
ncbi:GNAT family N-acetyltransferase [Streptosporangium soli]|nr:GNAT family N-acetyltransferase [Streptosporangium sp. KLBMP 9127]